MDDIKINGRAIYTTKGAAREYGRVGCNFYTGCPHECSYCYLKRGAPSKQLGGNVVQLKKAFSSELNAIYTFNKERLKYGDVLRKYGIFLSFTTDPLIPETRELTIRAIFCAHAAHIPVKVLTKDAGFINDNFFNLYVNGFNKELIEFGFTLTGRDEMESKASSNLERIETMRRLHKLGFRTWASIEPVIDWQHARMVIEMSLDCCDHYKIGLRSGVKKDYYGVYQSGTAIDELTKTITAFGHTVYLKESTRKLLKRCFTQEYYKEILSRSLDIDGKKIKFNGKE